MINPDVSRIASRLRAAAATIDDVIVRRTRESEAFGVLVIPAQLRAVDAEMRWGAAWASLDEAGHAERYQTIRELRDDARDLRVRAREIRAGHIDRASSAVRDATEALAQIGMSGPRFATAINISTPDVLLHELATAYRRHAAAALAAG